MLLWGSRRCQSLWANAESRAQIPTKRSPPSPPPILRVGRHPDCPKRLEGFPWHRDLVLGHVRQGVSIDGGRISPLLPSDWDRSVQGLYCFMPRSPLMRLVCDTPDSNRNWKSRYFFMEGDEWMCHPGDNEYMHIDKTWGIMPPSGMPPSAFRFLLALAFTCYFNHLLLQPKTIHKSNLNNGAFWKKISTKTSCQRGCGLS